MGTVVASPSGSRVVGGLMGELLEGSRKQRLRDEVGPGGGSEGLEEGGPVMEVKRRWSFTRAQLEEGGACFVVAADVFLEDVRRPLRAFGAVDLLRLEARVVLMEIEGRGRWLAWLRAVRRTGSARRPGALLRHHSQRTDD